MSRFFLIYVCSCEAWNDSKLLTVILPVFKAATESSFDPRGSVFVTSLASMVCVLLPCELVDFPKTCLLCVFDFEELVLGGFRILEI